jgi:hypothetical protein
MDAVALRKDQLMSRVTRNRNLAIGLTVLSIGLISAPAFAQDSVFIE